MLLRFSKWSLRIFRSLSSATKILTFPYRLCAPRPPPFFSFFQQSYPNCHFYPSLPYGPGCTVRIFYISIQCYVALQASLVPDQIYNGMPLPTWCHTKPILILRGDLSHLNNWWNVNVVNPYPSMAPCRCLLLMIYHRRIFRIIF